MFESFIFVPSLDSECLTGKTPTFNLEIELGAVEIFSVVRDLSQEVSVQGI